MTSFNSLKKEVEILHKVLNINQEVPEWKKRSDEIQWLLEEYEQLGEEEKQKQTEETYQWYIGELKK
jgi:hypothetical protein